MFLRCLNPSLTYTEADSGSTVPIKLNFIDFSTPVKSINGPFSGPTMVASFLESLHFRTANPAKIAQANIEQITAAAKALDVAYEDAGTIEDFVASDDGYVTLENFLKALKTHNKFIKGNLTWCKTVKTIKQFIHRYKCAIVECYLANSFLSQNASFTIDSAGTGTIPVKDYTKCFIAFGYDENYVYVQNSLGLKYGSLGFAKIKWSVLTGNVNLPDEGDKQCLIKAAAFKNCFN